MKGIIKISIISALLIVFSVSVFFYILIQPKKVKASPDVETRNATSNYIIAGKWFFPQNAYTSNDVRTNAFADNTMWGYGDYGFDIPSGSTITKVELGLEGYVTEELERICGYISFDGGTDWLYGWCSAEQTETMHWIDVTDETSWTPEKLNDTNLKTLILFDISGGGCYPDNMYFVVIENTSLLEKELLDITDWQFYNPKQIDEMLKQNKTLYVLSWNEEKEWFIDEDSEIVQVDIHDEGNYTLYDMYSGVLDINYTDEDGKEKKLKWESHIELTDNHKIPYSLDGIYWVLDTAESLYEHWDNGETVYVNHLWWNYTLKPFPVTDVKVTKKYSGKVYNVWTKGAKEDNHSVFFKKGKTLSGQEYDMLMHLKKQGVPIGKFPPFLSITTKVPWTGYVDWIPVRVTYSVAEDTTKPYFTNEATNTTVAGEPVNFSVEVNDETGLSHCLFETNNTGTRINHTWTAISGTVYNCFNITTLNSTIGSVVQFRWYANDTSNNTNSSEIYNLTTTDEPPTTTTTLPLFMCEERLCYRDHDFITDLPARLEACSILPYYPYFLIFEDTKNILWVIVCD